MVHDESHLISVMECRIPYRSGMFLFECDCEKVSGHYMCT